jgi:hypothetical protein
VYGGTKPSCLRRLNLERCTLKTPLSSPLTIRRLWTVRLDPTYVNKQEWNEGLRLSPPKLFALEAPRVTLEPVSEEARDISQSDEVVKGENTRETTRELLERVAKGKQKSGESV